ncbi:hypothetical protein Tco_0333385 [Tanacetum coccineum]
MPTSSSTRPSASTRHKGKEIAKPVTPQPESVSEEDRQFGNQRTMTVAGARETVGSQAETGVPLQAEQADWLADTDEEIDEQELEAHYSFMAKIQEDLPYRQPESINDTYVLEKDDSNVTLDSSNICKNDNQVDQNDAECVDERAALANLIANLTLDTEENKTILKQLKKANASLTQELKECRTNLDETGRALGEATSCRDSCLIALQNKQNEFEKYKAFNDRTIDYDILQIKKPKSYFKELYENTNKAWKWWIEKKCPLEYKWTQTTPSRPSLKWKPTGRIFSNVRLRWVPTGKLFNSCTGKVDSEPTHGSIVDIPHIHACKQTLGLSAGKSFNGQKQQRIDLNADALYNAKQENLRVWPRSSMFKRRLIKVVKAPVFIVQMTYVHISSGLVLHQITSDHNRSELGIHVHSNEPSSSKLVPKVVPLAVRSYITTRVGITIPPSNSNAEDNSHKVVRLGINPMIQPEPEDLPKDNPKLEIAVLRMGQYIILSVHKLIADIENAIMDPLMQCAHPAQPHSEFRSQNLIGKDFQEYGLPIPETMLTEGINIKNAPQAAVEDSNESDSEPARKQTTSRRVIKKKVSISADDNIIPEPDVTLELGKSMSLTEAPARRRPSGIAFKDTSRVSKKMYHDLSQKLKVIQTLTLEEKLADDTMQELKASRKSNKSQSLVEGSSEGLVFTQYV